MIVGSAWLRLCDAICTALWPNPWLIPPLRIEGIQCINDITIHMRTQIQKQRVKCVIDGIVCPNPWIDMWLTWNPPFQFHNHKNGSDSILHPYCLYISTIDYTGDSNQICDMEEQMKRETQSPPKQCAICTAHPMQWATAFIPIWKIITLHSESLLLFTLHHLLLSISLRIRTKRAWFVPCIVMTHLDGWNSHQIQG